MWSVSLAQQDQGKVLYTLPKPPQAANLALPGFLFKDLMKIDKECGASLIPYLCQVLQKTSHQDFGWYEIEFKD